MARSYPETHVSHGTAVGYSLKQRGDDPTYFVYFRAADGRRLERGTNQKGKERAREAARALIDAEFAPAAAAPAAVVSWEAVRERLDARLKVASIRPATATYYRKLLIVLQKAHPDLVGPAEVTPGTAEAFRDRLMTTPGRGGKMRAAVTVAGTVNGLSALWQKWLHEELKLVVGNPWEAVEPPKTDSPTVRWATDERVDEFYAWLADRFGGWPLPLLFFRTKSQTGCRLEDLCSLRPSQLAGGAVTFTADTTKGRKTRTIPLTPDLYAALERLSGPRYVWESYPADLKQALARKGWPSHRLLAAFDPGRMVAWVMTLFADFNADRPGVERLTSHHFRKRAFTMAKLAGVDSRDAAVAFGCNPDTMARHYVGVTETEIAAAVAAKLAARLDRLASPNTFAQQKDGG